MKSNFLFVGLNLNTIVQEKKPEACTFHGWCFKNKEHQKYLNVETRLLFSPALIKFLATPLVPLLVQYLRKDLVLCFSFDLRRDVNSSILYLSKLTKFGLYHNFWA